MQKSKKSTTEFKVGDILHFTDEQPTGYKGICVLLKSTDHDFDYDIRLIESGLTFWVYKRELRTLTPLEKALL